MANFLSKIATEVNAGKSQKKTLRTLLRMFGQERRGAVINRLIAENLAENGLKTKPDFLTAYIDEDLQFVLIESDGSAAEQGQGESNRFEEAEAEVGEEDNAASRDHTNADPQPNRFRAPVRSFITQAKLDLGLIRVSPTSSLQEAVTLMLYHEFSQLPVMANDSHVLGVITWRTIGQSFALGGKPVSAKECMAPAVSVDEHDSIIKLINLVQQNEFALVRAGNRKYVTLFTAADLGDLYRELSEAFIKLGQIEEDLRTLLRRANFTEEELANVLSQENSRKQLTLERLSFGDYIVLIETPANWERLKLNIDRAWFVKVLDQVREIRNAVMHFSPDGLTPQQNMQLERFSELLRVLCTSPLA